MEKFLGLILAGAFVVVSALGFGEVGKEGLILLVSGILVGIRFFVGALLFPEGIERSIVCIVWTFLAGLALSAAQAVSAKPPLWFLAISLSYLFASMRHFCEPPDGLEESRKKRYGDLAGFVIHLAICFALALFPKLVLPSCIIYLLVQVVLTPFYVVKVREIARKSEKQKDRPT